MLQTGCIGVFALLSCKVLAQPPEIVSRYTAASRQEFDQFLVEFGRKYSSAEEEEKRFAIFFEKAAWIRAENRKNHTYTLGINAFTDMTSEEFAAIYTNFKAPADKHWFGGGAFLGHHASVDGLQLPSSIDWVAKGAVTPVKNQGQCGSCWAFSIIGALEGAWQVETGELLSLSEQELVDCDSQEDGCRGGYPPEVFQWVESQNVCTEQSYPYKEQSGACHASGCSLGITSGTIVGYKMVTKGDTNAMMQALLLQPISIALDANDPWGSYSNGVLQQHCGASLNHAVLLVGYGSDSVDYWKVKNSWGTSWGENGYIRMIRGSDGDECGLLDQGAYAVVNGSPLPPSPTPPSPSPVPPSPTPIPSPCDSCKWNSDCPTGEQCYYPSSSASSGCCSRNPPNSMILV